MLEKTISCIKHYKNKDEIDKAVRVYAYQSEALTTLITESPKHIHDFDTFYWQLILDRFPAELMSSTIADHFFYTRFDSKPSVTLRDNHLTEELNQYTSDLISKCENLRSNSSRLLLDPRVALRYHDYLLFLSSRNNQEDQLGLMALRQEFIDWLDTKYGKVTLYRGYLLESEDGFVNNSHLAPKIRALCAKNAEFISKQRTRLSHKKYLETFGDIPFKADHNLPILKSLVDQAIIHIRDHANTSSLISTSKHLDVIEYALGEGSDSTSKLKKTKSALKPFIYSFDVPYFYQIPRTLVLPHLANPKSNLQDYSKAIESGAVPFTDEGYEVFLLFSLPMDFNKSTNRVTQ